METLNNSSGFKFQNDSFRKWCEEHQGEVFTVLKVYHDGTLRLNGYNFVISSNYTNYKVMLVKQLRDEVGCSMMDCKKALVMCDWNYDKAKEEIKSWGFSGFIDKWVY